MPCLLYKRLKRQYQRRQYRDTAEHSENNALCHYDTQVFSKRESHEAKCQEACDCSKRAARYRNERVRYRMRHRFFLVSSQLAPLFFVAVPQEYRVVHRDSQLQHCAERFRDIGYLTHEHIRPQIVEYRHTYSCDEYKRYDPRVHEDRQHYAAEHYGYGYIYGFFFFGQFLQVFDECCHAADEALFAAYLADLRNCTHALIRRCRLIEEHCHQRRVSAVEFIVDVLGDHLIRN